MRLDDRRPLKRLTPPTRKSALRCTSAPARSAALERVSLAAASEEQRRKVDGRECLVCGRSDGVDPAHLAPRSRGGCDDPECVVPLCRHCHRMDHRRLDLLPHLEPRSRRELAHALEHVGVVALLERLNERWRPATSRAA